MPAVIRVKQLSKSYLVKHETQPYTALRDVITDRVKKIFSFPYHFNAISSAKASEKFWALRDLNFELEAGDRLGIIGKNGAGKSTLLKILSRITQPDSGRVEIVGRLSSLLEVGTGFHPELTGRENIFLNGSILGMSKAEIRQKFDEIVDFSGIEFFLDTPVKRYSSGMYVKLAFSVAAHLIADILVVDEVLAVGDAEFQQKCLGKMDEVSRTQGKTVLLVSHQMNSILQICNKTLLLKEGQINAFAETPIVVQQYIQSSSRVNTHFQGTDYIQSIEVKQEGVDLVITALFDSPVDLDIPHLGFVLYNHFKTPILGSNPTIDQAPIQKGRYRKGEMTIRIKEPGLIDGLYYLSIWFGNSLENFFIAEDCLTIELSGMHTKINWHPFNISGNIVPAVIWEIHSYSSTLSSIAIE